MNGKKSRIRIVDDDEAVLRGMKTVLELEGFEVSTYLSGHEFLTSDAYSVPGCVILDLKMPELSGLQVQKILKERHFEHPIIFLTAHGEVDSAVLAMKNGAHDFLQKPISPAILLQKVTEALQQDLRGLGVDSETRQKKLASLSARESQVIKKVLQDLSNKEIGEALGLSERTIENHRASAYKKLGVSSAIEVKKYFNV